VKRKLSRESIEILSIKSACEFCKNMEVTPSIANISMVTGFSEEKILERIDHDFPANTRPAAKKD
jgi:predicted house-cleaning noncanonical NTP pyrophosphatase (MazG superfamily)